MVNVDRDQTAEPPLFRAPAKSALRASLSIILKRGVHAMRPPNFSWLILFATLLLSSGSALAATIYLGSEGSDSADGSSETKAVATLERAVNLSFALRERTSEPLRIVVLPGTYRGQSLVIDGGRLPGDLTIIGQGDDPKEFPIFVGDGRQTTWMTVKLSNGKNTGLTIQALQIRDYFTAISLEGNRDDPNAGNSGTTIRRNIFRRIGSIATTRSGNSTAAIRLVNSKNNLIENNYFNTIRNKDAKECGSLHSIYLAHFSSDNRIVNNTFDDACGSVIKMRDRSNSNQIENNRFSRIEKAPIMEEWYCDAGARTDCTKVLGECPSTGNMERGNQVTNSPSAAKISVAGDRVPRKWCSGDDYARARLTSR